ncbi:MAG TPA: STAS domain-containing protein [Actinocrinis sp.]
MDAECEQPDAAPAREPDSAVTEDEADAPSPPSPEDEARLRSLLTRFPATPLFAQMLAQWSGPAASMVTAGRRGGGDALADVPDMQQQAPSLPYDAVLASAIAADGNEPRENPQNTQWMPARPRDTDLTPAQHQPHDVTTPAVDADHPENGALLVEVSGGLRAIMLAVRGEVRSDTVGLLIDGGRRALDMSPLRLIVDLRGVTQFSAAGLRALLELRQAAAKDATQFRLQAPSLAVRTALDATSTRAVFRIDGDTRERSVNTPSAATGSGSGSGSDAAAEEEPADREPAKPSAQHTGVGHSL